MIIRNKKIIAISPWENIKEMLIFQGIKHFSDRVNMDFEVACRFFEEIEDGKPITQYEDGILTTGGIGFPRYWLRLQEIYDKKVKEIKTPLSEKIFEKVKKYLDK